MAKKTEAERLAGLSKRKEEIEAQMQTLTRQKRKRERKEDTRRKILAGAVVLTHAEQDKGFKSALLDLLDRFVERDQDRRLFAEQFNLKPKTTDPPG